ncbi:unnamed protein product, partial [Polarella glacialis]
DALGINSLVFGGDCAAGLKVDSLAAVKAETKEPGLAVDEVDRYEARSSGGSWSPAVIRGLSDDGLVTVELYAPGSFWSERLNRSGPFVVEAEDIRPRQWEVCRGEVLRIPDNEVLKLHHGQHLWVRPRGPCHDEPAGRLEPGEGAYICCEGGVVENDGVFACVVTLQMQHGVRRFKVDIESIKTLLVDCLEGVPDLPLEERGVVLQCFTWVFERAYRQMRLRTLGGRGWYLADEGQEYPKHRSFHGPDHRLPPRVLLYEGFVASTAY